MKYINPSTGVREILSDTCKRFWGILPVAVLKMDTLHFIESRNYKYLTNLFKDDRGWKGSGGLCTREHDWKVYQEALIINHHEIALQMNERFDNSSPKRKLAKQISERRKINSETLLQANSRTLTKRDLIENKRLIERFKGKRKSTIREQFIYALRHPPFEITGKLPEFKDGNYIFSGAEI